MIENWKDIQGVEGIYQVSDSGKIKSVSRVIIKSNGTKVFLKELILTPGTNQGKYYFVSLVNKNRKKKSFLVNRIVAITFIPNPENKPEVNHKDGNRINNALENLEWVTKSENVIHSYSMGKRKKLTSDIHGRSKLIINLENGIFYYSVKDAADSVGITQFTLHHRLKDGREKIFTYA